jgi:hypothetical protein
MVPSDGPHVAYHDRYLPNYLQSSGSHLCSMCYICCLIALVSNYMKDNHICSYCFSQLYGISEVAWLDQGKKIPHYELCYICLVMQSWIFRYGRRWICAFGQLWIYTDTRTKNARCGRRLHIPCMPERWHPRRLACLWPWPAGPCMLRPWPAGPCTLQPKPAFPLQFDHRLPHFLQVWCLPLPIDMYLNRYMLQP